MGNSNVITKAAATRAVLAKIGLEIHLTLASRKKIFSFSSNCPSHRGVPGSVGAWELGYLGTLPLLNGEVLSLALKACLLLKAEISRRVVFDRKMYNYFDLPKGFQITQQEEPIGRNGSFTFVFHGEMITIPIKRIQLEEDTARASYRGTEVVLDFSRSGNPLLEIVTEPVFTGTGTVVSFIRQLQSALSYTGVSEARMEEGELRVDLNFSFIFDQYYSTPRYEVKNLNSIKNLKLSFQEELTRQLLVYNRGGGKKNCSLESQTLGFDEASGRTFVQRKKMAYHYLPESNIPVILIREEEVASLARELPVNLSSLWSRLKADGKQPDPTILLEKPLFARMINALERERIDYPASFTAFAAFFFNYVLVSTQGRSSSGVIRFFDEKVKHLWHLFISFRRKLLAKEKISVLLSRLLAEGSDYSTPQWEQLVRKEGASLEEPMVNIEEEVVIILQERKIKKKLGEQPVRLANFLLGALKRKFPSASFDYQRVLTIASDLARKLTA